MTYRVLGAGAEPALVVAGGPLLDPEYLGDLGGLTSERALAVPHLPRLPLSEIVPVLESVREDLALESVDVVAHSAGASAALLYLAQWPDRVRRLVLITPAVRAVGIGPDEQGVEAVLAARRREPGLPEAITAWKQDPGSLKAQRVFFGAWGEAQCRLAQASIVERADRLAIYYADPRPEPAVLRQGAATFNRPVTIVRGEVDLHPTRRQAEDLAALFPQVDVVAVAGGGHYPWLDSPAEFVGAVQDALGRP